MSEPLKWSSDAVRLEFFAQLPRPLAVMLACDIAALPPQPPVGAEAIEWTRRWIMGAAEPREVRLAARAAAFYAPNTAHPAYAAAAAANMVYTNVRYLAYSASAVCEAVHSGAQRGLDMQLARYGGQSRRVEFLRQAMEEDHVRLLVAANQDDPAARPILWDAMLDAGYTPQPTRLLEEGGGSRTAGETSIDSKAGEDFIAGVWRRLTGR
jgi:hypothetical protein